MPTIPGDDWLLGLPKAEVHVHLEGCIPWDLLDRAAVRAGCDSPRHPGGIRSLPELLDTLDRSCKLLTTDDQITELAYAAGKRAASSGARWTDFIINPTHWPAWQNRLPRLIEALDRGFAAAERDGHGAFGLCPSLKRSQDAPAAMAFVDELLALDHPRVVALSIDGNEAAEGRTAARFAPAFERAAEGGLHRCVHAGESSGPEGVRDALHRLLAERIDHGVRAIEDDGLVAELAHRRVPLDICPTSNVRLGIAPGYSAHPLERLRRAGVRVSVNTDDPVLLDIDLLSEYRRSAEAFDWTPEDVRAVARTSLEAAFAPPAVKTRLLAELDAYPDPSP